MVRKLVRSKSAVQGSVLAAVGASLLAMTPLARPSLATPSAQGQQPVSHCWGYTEQVIGDCIDCIIIAGNSIQNNRCTPCKWSYFYQWVCEEGGTPMEEEEGYLTCDSANFFEIECPQPQGGVAGAFFFACSTCQPSDPWPDPPSPGSSGGRGEFEGR